MNFILTLLLFASHTFAQKLTKLSDKTTFESPILMTFIPGDNQHLFVGEQGGKIKFFDRKNIDTAKVFLDIKSRVDTGGEKGLLGLAFHPKFTENGLFFINYTAQLDNKLKTVIARFKADPKTLKVDPATETKILLIDQPASNHNGGTLLFGQDGHLYIAVGDGGFGGDPQNNSQNKENLLGKILRINIDAEKYTIPSDNPFKTEIFAYGLRNPWKMSFDSKTGDLWAADVGQNKWEEINIVTKGGNYGWRLKEGDKCYNPATGCEKEGLIDPIFQYAHDSGDCSITGGHVYRGNKIKKLQGQYVYGDFCSGKIWSLNRETKSNSLLTDTDFPISSFGVDQDGELYVVNYSTGEINRFNP